MAETMVGLIGGTGLGDALLRDTPGEAVEVETPFGPPSSPITLGEIDGTRIAALARHGPGHRFPPSLVPYRANVFALKQLGVTHVLASGAVGSLQEKIAPTDLVIADQVIDKTVRGGRTFFDTPGLVAHVELADPFCPSLRALLQEVATGLAGVTVHPKGTYVCMEGPQFSTKAESLLHRQWGADLIGMTAMPEAKLAREAELCYALVAVPTDYDCWRAHDPDVEPESVIQTILANVAKGTASAVELMRRTVPRIAGADVRCDCRHALKQALWTDRAAIPAERIETLRPLVGRCLEG